MFFDIEEVRDYIKNGNFAALDEVIECLNEQVTERESPYYLQFNYFSAGMEALFKHCMQARTAAMDEWLDKRLDRYIKDYDDLDFVTLFFAGNPTPAQKITRFQAYLAQTTSPLVRFSDCTLNYASHTAFEKSIDISTQATFPVLQQIGNAASRAHQNLFHKFNNFSLAILRLVVRNDNRDSYDYYRLLDIPIKDEHHAVANLSDYAGQRDITSISGRLRSSQLAKDIEARYQSGVALAKEKDADFNEHKGVGQVLTDVVQNSDYEHEYHHSELSLFQYLESDACIMLLISYLQKNNVTKHHKIYAAILDIYSTQQYCQNCEISSLGLQAKQPERFFSKFEKALLNTGYQVPIKTRTKYGVLARGDASWMREKIPGIKTAIRCIANNSYDDKRRKKRSLADVADVHAATEFLEPLRKNLKTDTPVSVIKIKQPEPPQLQNPGSAVNQFTLFTSSKIQIDDAKRLLIELQSADVVGSLFRS
jgi:hypothetical protein